MRQQQQQQQQKKEQGRGYGRRQQQQQQWRRSTMLMSNSNFRIVVVVILLFSSLVMAVENGDHNNNNKDNNKNNMVETNYLSTSSSSSEAASAATVTSTTETETKKRITTRPVNVNLNVNLNINNDKNNNKNSIYVQHITNKQHHYHQQQHLEQQQQQQQQQLQSHHHHQSHHHRMILSDNTVGNAGEDEPEYKEKTETSSTSSSSSSSFSSPAMTAAKNSITAATASGAATKYKIQRVEASHHTFASARHHHTTDTEGSSPTITATTTITPAGTYSTASTSTSTTTASSSSSSTSSSSSSSNNKIITPNHHVVIQESYLPYGARGRPQCNIDAALQLIVQCQEGKEQECYKQLDAAGIEVVNSIRGTSYFAICIDTTDSSVTIIEQLKQLEYVVDVELDPPRDLAYIRGSERIVNMTQLALLAKAAKEEQGKDNNNNNEGRLLRLGVNNKHKNNNNHDSSSGQQVPFGLEMTQVLAFWERYPTKGDGVTVCIVDTGILAEHEDIDRSKFEGSDDVDLVLPWFKDGYSHGSHVTGIVAAADNNVGIVGVAPNVNIFVARVFDDEGTFSASSLIEAMKECHDVGKSDVINMSIGGDSTSRAEENKVNELVLDNDVLIVAAAGNFGDDTNLFSYPGGYENIMSVAALDEDGKLASFSCFNPSVTLSGPGLDVLSISSKGTDSYMTMSGTSQASPYVAGVAALLRGQFPEKSALEIREAMVATAKDLGACGTDRVFGAGLVQALDAALYLEGNYQKPQQEEPPCIPVDVTVHMDSHQRGKNNNDKKATPNANATRYDIWELDLENYSDNGDCGSGADTLVYRGGLFEPKEHHEDHFSLKDGCYKFVIWDKFGHGFQDDGYYELSYNNVRIISTSSFSGSKQATLFGSCPDSMFEKPTTAIQEYKNPPMVASFGNHPDHKNPELPQNLILNNDNDNNRNYGIQPAAAATSGTAAASKVRGGKNDVEQDTP